MIELVTMKDGKIVLHKYAKPSTPLGDVEEFACCEVEGGYADYAKVLVDGEIYSEYEA